MPHSLSRRDFLGLSIALPLFPSPVTGCAAAAEHGGHASEPAASAATPLKVQFAECPECRGLGMITCPACDGTGMWTEASETAGLYQREAARASGHCAWCNEGGEAPCPNCDGTAGILACHNWADAIDEGAPERRQFAATEAVSDQVWRGRRGRG
jgi:DnaJ-class molecular chaperone